MQTAQQLQTFMEDYLDVWLQIENQKQIVDYSRKAWHDKVNDLKDANDGHSVDIGQLEVIMPLYENYLQEEKTLGRLQHALENANENLLIRYSDAVMGYPFRCVKNGATYYVYLNRKVHPYEVEVRKG